MNLDKMTEPVIAYVDPDTYQALTEFADRIMPGWKDIMFPWIVGKILVDLTALGLDWTPAKLPNPYDSNPPTERN